MIIFTDDFFSPNNNYPTDDIVRLVDNNTFEDVSFKKTTNWYNGNPMEDSFLDNFVYRKKNNTYYVDTAFISTNSFNAKKIGLKADGISNDTISLQKAINIALKLHCKLILPKGVIIITNTILIDISPTENRTSYELEGAGIGVTIIKSENDDELNTALHFKGVNDFQFVKIKGFSIKSKEGVASGGTGFKFEQAVYVELEDIDIYKFSTGIIVNDVALAKLNRINTRYCKKGFVGKSVYGGSHPNLLNFVSCGFHSNEISGVFLENCHNVKFDSCGFEGNFGNPLEVTFSGVNGSVGLNAINNYFEGNKGEADIKITNYNEGVHNIIGNTFNRNGSDYTYYNILVGADAQGVQVLNMIGNGFFCGNDFVPDLGKPSWFIPWNSESFEVVDFNYYDDEILRPNLNLKNIIRSKKEYYTGSLNVNADGSYTNVTNGLSSSRYGKGNYLIVLPNNINSIKNLQITALQGDASVNSLPSFGYGILNSNTLQIICRDINGPFDNGFLLSIECK